MKIQTKNKLIQDMKLKVGEVFRVGKNGFLMRYDGAISRNGKTYDRLSPVK